MIVSTIMEVIIIIAPLNHHTIRHSYSRTLHQEYHGTYQFRLVVRTVRNMSSVLCSNTAFEGDAVSAKMVRYNIKVRHSMQAQ